MARPHFSIVITTHLRANLLRRALLSLQAQTLQDHEVIVVADAWEAETAAVTAECLGARDQLIKRSSEQPGPALSRNLGMRQAQGEWVVFLDDDDTFAPHHLAVLKQQTLANPSPVLFTDCEVLTEDRKQPGIPVLSRNLASFARQDVASLWVKNFIPLHALAYRRSLLEDLSFDGYMASQEDWEFLLAVCQRAMPAYYAGGGAVMHKDFVNPGLRRGQQETSNNTTVLQDFIYAYKRRPAPTPELKALRKQLLAGVGLDLPLDWF